MGVDWFIYCLREGGESGLINSFVCLFTKTNTSFIYLPSSPKKNARTHTLNRVVSVQHVIGDWVSKTLPNWWWRIVMERTYARQPCNHYSRNKVAAELYTMPTYAKVSSNNPIH